jgi:4-aminobutyrate aminotransferase-like enzyme
VAAIGDVRGLGAMLAIELVATRNEGARTELALGVIDAALDAG